MTRHFELLCSGLLLGTLLDACAGNSIDFHSQANDTSAGGTQGSIGGTTSTVSPGGASAAGGAVCDWGDAGLATENPEPTLDASTSNQPAGTCLLLMPQAPLHYTTEQNSPCPLTEPDNFSNNRACPRSEIGVRSVYPSAQSSDAEDIWTCTEEGGTLDTNGTLSGSTVTNWELPGPTVCKRTRQDCLIGLDEECGLTSPRIELTTSCADRTVVRCTVFPDETEQTVLDGTVGVPEACLTGSGYYGETALSVWFNGDCPTSFIVYPADIADCVKGYLETVRFDCAAGLVCGATGLAGGCPC